MVGGAKTEVDGRVAVVDERVELTRAGLVRINGSQSELHDGGGSSSSTAVGRLAVTC